ncbi:MAG: ImmA/IrrE family metallo-endopeptidase [Eubacteriales bacterium]|nr:ImmA/IrrE family metallo-endopeptidase [Eubacteriales bacterium]
MANLAYISEVCEDLIERNQSRNPQELARAEGIHLYPRANFQDLRGMYLEVNGWPCIFYKANLPEAQIREVLAHELGHHCLHRDYIEAGQEFIESSLFDPRSKLEREANFFAAELLISDEFFFELLGEEAELAHAASESGYNINFWLYKAKLLQDRGEQLKLPFSPSNDFW